MLDSYKDMLKNYFSIKGKVDKHNYWLGLLIMLVIMSVLIWFADKIDTLHMLPYIFAIAMIIPTVTATVRRLHDVCKSGWRALLGFIPVVGWICLFIYLIHGTASDEDIKHKQIRKEERQLIAPRLRGGYGN